MILKYPITTEKAIRLIETQNTIVFVVDKRANKKEIKEEFEKTFDVKAEKIRTAIVMEKKIAYIKLAKNFFARDIATKLGMI